MNEHFKIFVPLLGVVFGLIIKYSKLNQNKEIKRYWWVFVILGFLGFIFRISNYILFD